MVALDPDAFANGVNQGSALVGNIRKQRAALTAGDAFSRGDYGGAAAALGGSGDIGGAMQVQQYGAQQAAQQKAQADQQRGEALTAMLHMATALKRVAPEQRQHAYQNVVAPLLQQQGLDPAHIDAMGKSSLDDQTLDATISTLGGEVQKLQEVAPGASLYDPSAGKVVYSAPEAPKWQAVPEGGTLVNTSAIGAGGQPGPGGTFAPGGGAQGASMAPTGGAAPAGGPPVRINAPKMGPHDVVQALQVAMAEDPKNPAGILSTIVNRAAQSGKTVGDVLREPGQFETVTNGAASHISPQHAQAMLNDPTIAGIMSGQIPAQYANVTQFYAPKAQAALGRQPPAWDDGTGFNVGDTRYFARPAGGGSAVPTGAQYGAVSNPNIISGRPKTMTRPATADEKKAYGIDPSTPAQIKPDGSIDVITGATPMNGDPVAANGATGEDLLKALDPATAAQVKSYADGRSQFPTGAALRAPYFQHMLSLVAQYDPGFDQVNYNARAATRKAFTSGQYSQNITSFNTALGHLNALDKTVDSLNNGPVTWFNGPKNMVWGNNNAESSAALAQFDADKTAVVDELPRVFRGSSGTVADVKHWEDQINSSKSPQALHETVRALANLIESRIQSLSDTYSAGMGKASDAHEFLSPKANGVLRRLGVADSSSFAGGDGGGGGGGGGQVAAVARPAAPAVQRTAGGATVSNW